jgi:oligosaccharide reducing-end xylanase
MIKETKMNNVMLRMGAITLLVLSALATPLSPANAQQEKAIPLKGASATGNWDEWNLFKQRKTDVSPYPRKYTDAQITSKLNSAYNQLFVDGDAYTQRICFDDPNNATDVAYIKNMADNDVRSEGISYGMMIAVQMDKPSLFNKLWKFATKYLKQDGYPQRGYFAWKVNLNPDGTVKYNKDGNGNYTVIDRDPNSASDGDIWMAMALFNASGRWGNGGGIFNYRLEANSIINAMLRREQWNNGTPNGLTNMFANNQAVFSPKNNQVVFTPNSTLIYGTNYGLSDFTDPSYHLPAFLEYFARYASQDNPRWWDITEKSRQYLLPRATGYIGNVNGNSVSALSPGYCKFDGTKTSVTYNGVPNGEERFTPEAYRVVSNIAVDYMWWGGVDNTNNKWNFHKNFGNRLLNFFTKEGKIGLYNQNDGLYFAVYTTDGKRSVNDNYSSTALIAMNTTGALISGQSSGTNPNNDYIWRFVDKLWSASVPVDPANKPSTQHYRYYGGCLYMLGLLQSSGKFRFWAPQ